MHVTVGTLQEQNEEPVFKLYVQCWLSERVAATNAGSTSHIFLEKAAAYTHIRLRVHRDNSDPQQSFLRQGSRQQLSHHSV